MGSKISADNPDSLVLLNGDEAVARGAIESAIKVAASYPGTPSTEILEAIAEVSRDLGIYTEWSINEIVATGVASGAAISGARSIVSMKHVGLNVASDAVMTLAYTGVTGGMVIVVCDDPSMHSSQNEQDTRYFSVHSNLPLLDAGSPQEAKDMTVEAFTTSEILRIPVIVRLTTRVAHGKGRVRLGEILKTPRKTVFDKCGSKWVMIPANALRQHRILQKRLIEAKKLTEQSKFNTIEDNLKEIGIIGSGIGYYYARSVLDTNQFSWLKLGFVNPFPINLVRRFAANKKKIVVVEELRTYIEDNVRCLNIEVLGKKELKLEEVGELTPDLLREAFARFGLCEEPEKKIEVELPSRPPVLCPGCPHRAFYYALNSVNKLVGCNPDKCIGCNICEYTCAWEKEKTFNPLKSRIRATRLDQFVNIAISCRLCEGAPCVVACPEGALKKSTDTGIIKVDESKCNGCGWCIEACDYGAMTLHPEKRSVIVCDTCEGEPRCVEWCPENALNFEGRSSDKIVTGDIGCYTLGVLPPTNTVQTCLCMGAGISQAAGMRHAGLKDKIFAVIGDSTFFHAGMPALLNIAYNRTDICVVILDNQVVAMTGHQPTPGTGRNLIGENTKITRIPEVAKSLGIDRVEVVDPYDIEATVRSIRGVLDYDGPSVIVSERPCSLLADKGPIRKVTKECNSCGECIEFFGCPALSMTSHGAEIDPTLCRGCGVCETICPYDAIGSTD